MKTRTGSVYGFCGIFLTSFLLVFSSPSSVAEDLDAPVEPPRVLSRRAYGKNVSVPKLFDINPRTQKIIDGLATLEQSSPEDFGRLVRQELMEPWYLSKNQEERNRITQYACLKLSDAFRESAVTQARFAAWPQGKLHLPDWKENLRAFVQRQKKCFATAVPDPTRMPAGVQDALNKTRSKVQASKRLGPAYRRWQQVVASQADPKNIKTSNDGKLPEAELRAAREAAAAALSETLGNKVESFYERGFLISIPNGIVNFQIDVEPSRPKVSVVSASLNMQKTAEPISGCNELPFASEPDWRLACALGFIRRPDLIVEEMKKLETALYVVDWHPTLGLSFEVVNLYENASIRPTPPDYHIEIENFRRLLGVESKSFD